MEENINIEKINDLQSIKINDMFSITYNFDILKYIITELIKNQQKLNYKLIDLKIEEVKSEKKVDELEMNLIDLQLGKKPSENFKKSLLMKKNKNKNYKDILDKLIKEKNNYIQLFKLGKNNFTLNEIENNDNIIKENEIITNNDLKEEIKEELKEEINDINNKISEIKEENENQIKSSSEKIESKIKNIENRLSLINNDIKITEEKLNKKISNDVPLIFENLFLEKIEKVNSKIDTLDKNNKKNLKLLEDSNNEINNKLESEKLKLEENIKDNQKIFKELKKINIKLEERINNCVEQKSYNSTIKNLENIIQRENKDINNKIILINQNLEKLETEITDIQNDQTAKNNIILLSTKCDNLTTDIFKIKELILDLQCFTKKIEDLKPEDLIYKNVFNDFVESNDKTLENIRKYLSDVKYIVDDIKIASSRGKATLKDLKNLEDKILNKINDFYDQITEKFAEKKFVLKNNRFLKIDIKKDLENYKNKEQSPDRNWLLSKKPIGGHLCASCEGYIGDLKESENFIPWNHYPVKDSSDKISNINHVFDKMYQKLSTDYKIRRNKSNLDLNSIKYKDENFLEDTEMKQSYTNLTNNKRKIVNIKNKIYDSKQFKIKEIPRLKITKKEDIQNGMVNNKYKTAYALDSKTEGDENIIIPETVINNKKNNEEENNQPKIMKVFKKLI